MDAYQLIRNSLFWDETYYKSQFNINWNGIDAIEHFLDFGARLGVSPSSRFDVQKYLTLNPDVASSGQNALLHYELYGKRENRQIRTISEKIHDQDWPRDAILRDSRLYNVNYDKKRIGIYTAANKDHRITDSQIHFLEYMLEVCDGVIYISQQYIPVHEIAKIKSLIAAYHCSNLFSSLMAYWVGLDIARQHNLSTRIDRILLCNEDAYGPLINLHDICQTAEASGAKVWSLTRSWHKSEHYEILFMNYDSNILNNHNFMAGLYTISQLGCSDLDKEIVLTGLYNKCALSCTAMFDSARIGNYTLNNSPKYSPLQYPLSLIEQGCPVIYRQCIADPIHHNNEGYIALMDTIRRKNRSLFNIALNEFPLAQMIHGLHFTIIMATYNRVHVIDKAISSVLRQTHKNYNLIIINDASSDHTGRILRKRYANLIKLGKIIIIDNNRNRGLAGSRNLGLNTATDGWVCYLDDDNSMEPFYLEYFAIAIALHPEYKLFYSQFTKLPQNLLVGRSFDYEVLLQGNYTDAGVIVHSLDLYSKYGGFTESLKTWEDFDFMLKMSAHAPPYYLPVSLLNYNDNHCGRMSNTIETLPSLLHIHKTHAHKKRISTILWGEGDDIDTSTTLSSIGNQTGGFVNEIWWINPPGKDSKDLVPATISNRSLIFHLLDNGELDSSTIMEEIVSNLHTELVMFMHLGDIWISPFMISEHVQYMENHCDCGISISPWLQIPGPQTPDYKIYFEKFKRKPSPLTAAPFSVSAFCIRRLYFTLCKHPYFTVAIDPRYFMPLLKQYTAIELLPIPDILCVTRTNSNYQTSASCEDTGDKFHIGNTTHCKNNCRLSRGFRKRPGIK